MFEWDEAKNASNVLKHKVYFADTFAVFEDSNSLTIDDFESGEQRFVTIGMVPLDGCWWLFTPGAEKK